MKILFRILLALVLLFVVGVFALNWFLEKGLTPAIQKALPTVEEKLGAPVEVGSASVSLFAGSMTLEDIRVGNPEGFEQPTLFSLAKSVQDIAILPLITKQEVRIEEVTIQESNLTVVRNTDGDINIKTLLANLNEGVPPEEEPAEEPAPEEEPPGEKGPLPPVELEQLLVTSLMTFIQEKESGDPFNLGLSLKVSGNNIGTIGEPSDRGTIAIRGNLAGNQDLFVINVNGKIAPITDPLAPTFEIEGKVDSVELQMFEVFQRDFKLKGGMMGLDMVLHAAEGVFDPEKSMVRVLINQPDLGSGMGIPAGYQPASLTFPVRVSGTVQEPEINFMQGLREGIQNALMGTGAGEKIQETVEQTKKQAQAAADQVKAQAEEASSKAKETANESVEALKEGKAPDLGGALNSLGGEKKEDGSPSDEEEESEEKEKKSTLGGFLDGF